MKGNSRSNREHAEQVALFYWMFLHREKHPAFKAAYAIPNAGKRSARHGAHMKDEGLRAGMPDLCIPYPCLGSQWPNGKTVHALYIEMKAPGKKRTQVQIDKAEELIACGNRVEVCYSWTEAARVICEHLGLSAEKLGVA